MTGRNARNTLWSATAAILLVAVGFTTPASRSAIPPMPPRAKPA